MRIKSSLFHKTVGGFFAALGIFALVISLGMPQRVFADNEGNGKGNGNGNEKNDDNGNGNGNGVNKPDPIGAWFGIARPCPASAVTDSPAHAAFCTAVCGACPNAGVLPPE